MPEIGAIAHTHSLNSVTWAQAGRALPPYGTTHADAFYGAVPCTRALSESEIKENYEEETGKVIVETFHEQELDPLAVPGVLVYGHGPFTWGMTPEKAVENSLILDEICSMARLTEIIIFYWINTILENMGFPLIMVSDGCDETCEKEG